jgi:hypothetical protein
MMSDGEPARSGGGGGVAEAHVVDAHSSPRAGDPHECGGYLESLSVYTDGLGSAWAEYGCRACGVTCAVPAGPPQVGDDGPAGGAACPGRPR